ncbi:MAG: glycosyltransferase [Anaerorhabdus sp.]|uniref:glycosyltransferase n=1 Tax=Anaerorhabdus sp. TaxID=1872524 RepID=UPI002FC958C4
MKKIIHLLSTSKFSGAENVVIQICSMFSDQYEMIYVCKSGEIEEKLTQNNIKYVLFNHVLDLNKIIKEVNPDIIHAHDVRASIYSCLFFKGKIISHIHGNSIAMRKKSCKSMIYKIFCKRFLKIIWVSSSCFNSFIYRNLIANKSLILKNVLFNFPLKENYDMSNHRYDLLYLGRLDYEKNPLLFVEVVNKLKKSITNISAVMVGNGVLEKDCIELIQKYKLTGNVDLLGFIENPYEVIANSKLLVMTSIYEGMPMAALESLALGKPIYATKTDGLVEIVVDNKNGYLTNNIELLVKEICKTLTDDSLLSEQSENAYKTFIEYNNILNYKMTLERIYES